MHALLLIDLQEDFFDPPALVEARPEIVSAVRDWVHHAQRTDALVIDVRTELPLRPSSWALNMRDDDQPVALRGTPGAERLFELRDLDLPTVIKRRDDAFVRTDLEYRLRAADAEHVVIAGVSTEACIALTAAGAYARDFTVSLAGGAIASADPAAHRQALRWLAAQYRQSVVPLPTGS